jgi:hypothetical protein
LGAKSGLATVRYGLTPPRSSPRTWRGRAYADPATRTYLAKFSLPDVGDDVSLGMTATLTLADAGASGWQSRRFGAAPGRRPRRLYRRRRRRGTLKPGEVHESNTSSPAASMRAPIVALGGSLIGAGAGRGQPPP